MHTDGIRTVHQPETRTPGVPRLGRHLVLDGRSAAHMIERTAPADEPVSREWTRHLPVLDQGDLGSCTGHAAVGALSTEPHASQLDATRLAARDALDIAVGLYAAATDADEFAGTWPPHDLGSSGLGVCRALHRRGVVAGYRWASTAQGLVRLLQDGPVLMGTAWPSAWFEPDRLGFVDHDDWETSPIVGGHEFEIVGVTIDRTNLGRPRPLPSAARRLPAPARHHRPQAAHHLIPRRRDKGRAAPRRRHRVRHAGAAPPTRQGAPHGQHHPR